MGWIWPIGHNLLTLARNVISTFFPNEQPVQPLSPAQESLH